ncbi:MAG: saccharopine dehydrogenase NADP-binding domain-containing protein [Planctomycetota bacterium]
MSKRLQTVILGAGKIGQAIVRLLTDTGDYDVRVGDASADALNAITQEHPVETSQIDVADLSALKELLTGADVVISACSFNVNPGIASVAAACGASYFDLTEDVATTRAVREIAAKAAEGQIFMPQCGLAPGYISVLAYDLCQQFEKLQRVTMRVGALPLYPTNMLKYNLTWSTDGLINEYCNLCEAIRDGEKVDLQPLEGVEHFGLDGVDYEAFNTSGGLGTLCETLAGRVTDLDYKTVRYVGHRFLMNFLLDELEFRNNRGVLKELLESAVPCTNQDVVLVFATASGWRDGRYEQAADARKIYHGDIAGQPASSIQITTATSVCAAVDLFRLGKLPSRGFVRQEDMSLADFEANRFGKPYAEATHIRAPISSTIDALN